MKHIKRALRMYRVFAAQELKRMMEYKADFIIGIVGFLLLQVSNLLFLWLIFRQVPDLMGWSVNEIVFIYGFSLLPKGLDHLLFDNLWAIGHYIVRKGEFDKYLTRPVNTLFHVMVEKFQTEALGELVVGAALVAVTLPQLNVSWSVEKVVLILVVIPFAATIYTAVKTITASVAFWSKRSGNIIFMFYYAHGVLSRRLSAARRESAVLYRYARPRGGDTDGNRHFRVAQGHPSLRIGRLLAECL